MARPVVTRRSTVQGAAIREALGSSAGFRSAQDVFAVLRSEGSTIGLSTVYRHLQALAERGEVDMVRTPDGEGTYRLCVASPSTDHHHHLVCRNCGRAEQVEARAVERWTRDVAARFGYTEVAHTVEVFGLCSQCSVRDS